MQVHDHGICDGPIQRAVVLELAAACSPAAHHNGCGCRHERRGRRRHARRLGSGPQAADPEGGRERASGRWRDGAALGRLSGRPCHRRSAPQSRCQREGRQRLRRDAAVSGRGERQPGDHAAPARRRSGRERAHAQQRHRAHDGGPDRQRRDDEAAARSRRRRERERNDAGHDGLDVGGGSATSGGRPVARRPRSERQRGLEPRLAGPARELRQSLGSETVEEARAVRQSDRSPEHAGYRRRGAHPAGVRGSRERSGIGAHSARGRRRREPGDELRVEPAARRDAESVLPARVLSARPWCRPEPRQQGRLVAAVYRGR